MSSEPLCCKSGERLEPRGRNRGSGSRRLRGFVAPRPRMTTSHSPMILDPPRELCLRCGLSRPGGADSTSWPGPNGRPPSRLLQRSRARPEVCCAQACGGTWPWSDSAKTSRAGAPVPTC
jgi:hypothetical protein